MNYENPFEGAIPPTHPEIDPAKEEMLPAKQETLWHLLDVVSAKARAPHLDDISKKAGTPDSGLCRSDLESPINGESAILRFAGKGRYDDDPKRVGQIERIEKVSGSNDDVINNLVTDYTIRTTPNGLSIEKCVTISTKKRGHSVFRTNPENNKIYLNEENLQKLHSVKQEITRMNKALEEATKEAREKEEEFGLNSVSENETKELIEFVEQLVSPEPTSWPNRDQRFQ